MAATNKPFLSEGLMFLFTRIANLCGIKQAIPQINKDDIKALILLRYKNLSLEEIDYAFRLERFGVYHQRTQHFQVFDASYVSQVLDNYRAWLRKLRAVNHLLAYTPKRVPELSEAQKQKIIRQGIVAAFEYYKTQGDIPIGSSYVYDHLYALGLLPIHTESFRKAVKRKAMRNLYRKGAAKQNRPLKRTLRAIQRGHQDSFRVECKYIVLRSFFSKVIANNNAIAAML